MWTVASLVGGLLLLVLGAELLVRGASRLALAVGVTPLVVGLTVVAFGTSTPELAVSVGAATSGVGGVAVGNAVGSNIFNVLAILGVSALLGGGLVVHQRIVRLDVPLLAVVSAVVWLLAADGVLGRLEGAALVGGIVVYAGWSYLASRRETAGVAREYEGAFGRQRPAGRGRVALAGGAVIGGLVTLVVGSQLLVGAATRLAEMLGVSDLVIGLTVVAAGTSLPELATSGIAARRAERDIAVGNVVGSNLFNLLAVLGASALVATDGLAVPSSAVRMDLPVALLVTLVALPALATGLVVARWEGVLLLGAYAGYLAVVVLVSLDHPAQTGARVSFFAALGGLALLPLLVMVAGRLRRRGPAAED